MLLDWHHSLDYKLQWYTIWWVWWCGKEYKFNNHLAHPPSQHLLSENHLVIGHCVRYYNANQTAEHIRASDVVSLGLVRSQNFYVWWVNVFEISKFDACLHHWWAALLLQTQFIWGSVSSTVTWINSIYLSGWIWGI